MIMIPIILLLWCFGSAYSDHAFKSKSTGSSPLHFDVKVGKDPVDVKLHVDINRPYSFVFHEACKDNCLPFIYPDNRYYYSENRTGGTTEKEKFEDKDLGYEYDAYGLAGQWFNDKLKFGDVELPIKFGAVKRKDVRPDWEYYGVLGLGLGRADDVSIVKPLFGKLTENKVVIQDTRRYILKEFKRVTKQATGSITFGKYDGDTCGNFTFTSTIDATTWRIRADVTVGKDVYKNQRIAFAIGQKSRFPKDIYEDKIYNITYTSADELPTVSFKIGDDTYQITHEDYAQYDDKSGSFTGDVGKVFRGYEADFVFGTDLLQHHCIALVANKDFTKLEIGFADNYGHDEEEDKENDGEDKSAAAYSLSLFMAVMFMMLLK